MTLPPVQGPPIMALVEMQILARTVDMVLVFGSSFSQVPMN